MIVSLSLMRRRPDIDIDQFRRHWLDPHGVMTAELPKVRRYVQGHVIDSQATSGLAREVQVDGFAVLSFDTYEDRQEAYTSPRIRECDRDSEEFVGSVSRVVTESEVVMAPPERDGLAKVYVLKYGDGGADNAWSQAIEARAVAMPGLCGYTRQTVLSQAAAPGSKIPELKLPVSGVAEIWFESEEAMLGGAADLAGGGDAFRAAVYVARDYRLI